jgi:hypothetical protein
VTYWLCIGGHKPLAHLPRWKRRLYHLPSIRWRLWPRPWNFNGPVAGFHAEYARLRDHRLRIWLLLHDATQEMTTERRVYWLDRAEEIFQVAAPVGGRDLARDEAPGEGNDPDAGAA